MAIYEVQAPDGSILEIEGPDGADEATVMAAAQSLYSGQSASGPPAGPANPPAESPGLLQRAANLVTGADRATPETQSLPDIGGIPELSDLSFAGAKAGLGTLFAGPKETAQIIAANYPGVQVRQDERGNYIIRSSIDGRDYAIKPGFQWSDIPKLAAGVAAFTPAGRATQAATGTLGRLGAGFAASGATQGAIEATQAATGGQADIGDVALSAALGGAIPAIGTAVGRGVQAVRNTQQSPLVQAAQREGVPLMTSDVLPPETFIGRTLQSTGERIPIAGTGPVRAAQQAARVQAVRNVADDFGVTLDAAFDGKLAADLAGKRSADLTKYTNLKRGVLQGLDQRGVVPVPRATQAIDAEVGRIRALGNPDLEPALRRLENIRNALQGKTATQVDEVRKQLGDLISDPNLANVRSTVQKIPSMVYGELRQDIDDFAKAAGPREATKLRVANARLRDLVGELDNARLKSALQQATETPEKTADILFSSKKSDVQRLFRNLTPKGREVARMAVIQRAVSQALPRGAQDMAEVSPQRFAGNIVKMGNQIGVFFSPQDRARLLGLSKVLRATQQASVSAAAPPTGVQAVPFFAGSFLTDMLGSAGAATGGAVGIGAIARAYESKPVRDILLRVSTANPNSPAYDRLIQQATTLLQAQPE